MVQSVNMSVRQEGNLHLGGNLQTRSVQTCMCKRAVGLATVHGGCDLCWMSHCSVRCDAGGDRV